MTLGKLDRNALQQQYRIAAPFPYFQVDNLLDPEFAREVSKSYPTFEGASAQGRQFKSVNEFKKVQITEATRFPEPVARLNAALSSREFLSDLSFVTGIPDLLADEQLVGGGMHITGPGGRLDVHVDFNFLAERKLHRRLNLLLYLNPSWQEQWGGHLQLWDAQVKNCQQTFVPALNRCVVFETSDISYHGVTPVSDAAPIPRQSFATYYYTREAPPYWKGRAHSTIFKARPDERLRKYVFMPVERARRRVMTGMGKMKHGIKRMIKASR